MRKVYGFTLIEMLVASAIFVLLGLASYQVLNTVIRSDKISSEASRDIQALQRLMLVMERDFMQIAPRYVRIDGEANTENLLQAGEGLSESEFQGIRFVRLGWRNPRMMLQRSTVQHVAYRVQEGRLERLHYLYPDSIVGEEPKVRVLAEQVENLSFKFFVKDKWQENWDSNGLPAAVAVEFEQKSFGKIRRVFLTPKLEVQGSA